MGLQPKIQKSSGLMKKCSCCGGTFGSENFIKSKSFLFDGLLPICNSCIGDELKRNDFKWEYVDKICQLTDIPFLPREWERIKEMNLPETAFSQYAQIFQTEEYETIGWDYYDKQFRQLRQAGVIEDELPEIREQKFKELKRKWGANYDDEELLYLEDLYLGMSISQNINGALQIDQARKICKLSLEIDSRIRNGDKDVDKFMSSYDKLVKSAEFTPKNAKNATDFDSMAEVLFWLEKRGFVNKYYDGTTRDIIDETLKNIQSYNQRLYVNEGSMGEEVNKRLQQLQFAQESENYYETNKEYDLEEYEMEAFSDAGEENFEEVLE